MTERKDLPPTTAANFLERVKEELTVYMGNRGAPMEQAVRFKDLADGNMIVVSPAFLAGRGNRGQPNISAPGTAITTAYTADLTPPPTPTGFTASAAITSLFVQHDPTLFAMGHGYLRTILYGASRTKLSAPAPTFANAVQLMQFTGTVTSYPTNPSTIWHLWIKWMTVDGVLSVSPAGGTNGLSVTTGQDVSLLMTALTGQITASQLFSDLGGRIDLIDAPSTALGSVNSRVAAESAARTTALAFEAALRLSGLAAENASRTSALASEAAARNNALVVESTTRADAILSEAAARASAVSGLQNQISTITAVAGGDLSAVIAVVQQEQTARATAVSAEAASRETLATQMRGAYTGTDAGAITTGLVFSERQARITAQTSEITSRNQAIASSAASSEAAQTAINDALIAGLGIATGAAATRTQAEQDARVASVTQETNARITAIDAEATARLALVAVVNTNAAIVVQEQQTRATADSAIATDLTRLSARTDANAAAIQSETMARSDAVSAEASARAALSVRVNTAEANIGANNTATASNSANISTEQSVRATVDSALGSRIDTVVTAATTDRSAFTSAITAEQNARANADAAEAQSRTTLAARVTVTEGGIATNSATINSEQVARVSADSGLATRIDTVQAVATSDRGTFTAAIATEQTARANADGTLFAQYSVKVDVNGYVAGFGLSSTANNGAPTSAFAVRADQFYIASPSGPGVAPATPFIVRTTATTINGVNVPVGVYIQDAFIANGTITNAKIGNAQIDDAKIANLSANKITGGSISVGSYINSTSYVDGSTGWSINSNGAAQFNNVVVRGTVYASAGSFSGDISASTGNFRGYVTGGAFTGYAWPPAGAGGGFFLGPSGLLLGSANDGKYFQVNSTGDIYAPQFNIVNGAATFAGALNAASGSFAGSLSAATGSFSGTLSAASAQVNTLNIAGNAVTIPFSTSFGTVAYGQQVSTPFQYLAGGSSIIIIVTYNVYHQQFNGANMTLGLSGVGFSEIVLDSSGFSFENYGNGVISTSYTVPIATYYRVLATPNGNPGGTCTRLVITAQGSQR